MTLVYSLELHQVSAVLDCFQYSQWTISINATSNIYNTEIESIILLKILLLCACYVGHSFPPGPSTNCALSNSSLHKVMLTIAPLS